MSSHHQMPRTFSISGIQPPASLRVAATLTIRPDHAITAAAQLDRLADIELAHGHHVAAEHLARKAQALREMGASA